MVLREMPEVSCELRHYRNNQQANVKNFGRFVPYGLTVAKEGRSLCGLGFSVESDNVSDDVNLDGLSRRIRRIHTPYFL